MKITKGTIDPVTEPDGNASSFYFNSKWSADVKINTLEAVNIPAGTSQYLPSGSNVNTYLKAMADVNATFDQAEFEVCIKNAWFDYMPYELPLFDIRWRRLSDNRYIEFNRVESSSGDGNGGQEPEYYRTFDGGRAAWWANKVNPVDSLERTYLGANPGNCLYYYPYDQTSRNPRDSRSYQTTAVIWRLPGDNSPILDAEPKAPVSGQFSIQITSDFCRVAKPGYDVRTATPTQLAFDSSGRPLSVIYANDVSIAPGVSSVNIGFPTTPNMLADLFPYTGSVITFPMARERRSLQLDYWFSGNSILFNNKESFAMRVRFLVFANDPESSTVGDNDVLRQFEAGGENVVQFLRPGAGNPPALRDVMIDSRWPCLQILKEGYITTKTNPNRGGTGGYEDTYEVNFDSAGVFPIVKYMTFHNTSALGRHVRPPLCAITRDYTDAFDYHQGRSTFCQLSAGKATFYTHNGNPDRERFRDGAWGYEFSPAQVLGIRYYILGFPS